MNQPLLRVADISIAFGGIKAVEHVSLEIAQGEVISLIGPNGAGKTTVFNLLTGVYQTQTGEIVFDGHRIDRMTPQQIVAAGLSRTFQNIRLFTDMRVIENVMVGTHIRTHYSLADSSFRLGRYRKEEDEKLGYVMNILDALELLDKKDEYAGNLPYGDQRKVEIARAIATGAKLLLLDEPAAGMNPHESEMLQRFILRLKELGFTALLIEHDMSVVMKISDRIYVLDNGRMIAQGLPEAVANDKRVIKAYLGGELHDA